MGSKIIAVIGSLNMDLVTVTPYIPQAGETMTATSFKTFPGGKGANQAVACARLSRPKPLPNSSSRIPKSKVTVKMHGALGTDEFAPRLLSSLESSFIDTTSIRSISGEFTGTATILVESHTGENRILLCPGANHHVLASTYSTASAFGEPLPTLMVLQLEIPLETVLQVTRVAHEAGLAVLLNPAPAVPLPEEIYKCITHLILNETEAALLSSQTISDVSDPNLDWLPICTEFLEKGVKNVVVTLGSKGAFWASASTSSSTSGNRSTVKSGFVPAFKVDKVVDTTAAGDTFVGAYAVAIVEHEGPEELDMNEEVRKACKAAARTVEKEGAQDAIPWADEV